MTTLLLVEDEPMVRLSAAAFLRDCDIQVIEAEDGPAAIAAIERNPNIDVLFSDLKLAGPMDGLELSRRAFEINPRMRMLLTSGDVRPRDLPQSIAYFEKPYRLEEIVSWIAGARGAAVV